MKLRYTKRAARQIDKALDYVAARSPPGAARVRERLQAAVMLLQLLPYVLDTPPAAPVFDALP